VKAATAKVKHQPKNEVSVNEVVIIVAIMTIITITITMQSYPTLSSSG
jgi:hypothetical protein